MRGSGWLLVITMVSLLYAGGCRCAEEGEKVVEGPPEPEYASTVGKLPAARRNDVAALIPAGADLVVLLPDPGRLLTWLESRPWYQEIRQTPFFDDLRISWGWLQLSSIKHRLESVSAVRLGEVGLEQLLSSPAGLALRRAGERREFLLVKKIDLRVQALDRLAEVLNQITPREGIIKTREFSGLKLRELTFATDRYLYYLLFSDMLLMSDSEAYLLQAVELARGQSSGSLAEDPEVAALLLDGRERYHLLACLDSTAPAVGAKGPPSGGRPAARVDRLMLRLAVEDEPRLEVTGVLNKDMALEEQNASFPAEKILPLDSRALLGLSRRDLDLVAREALGRAAGEKPLPAGLKGALDNGLFPALEGQALAVLGGVDVSAKQPVPHAGLLLKVDPQKTAEVTAAARELFAFLFGAEVSERVLRQMSSTRVHLLPGEGNFNPCFAVIDGWLAMCTTEEMLRRIAATAVGQQPAIEDLPRFTERVSAPGKPYFFLAYLDAGALTGDLLTYFGSLAALGGRFDAAAVEETLAPVLEALGKLGRVGGAITQRGAGLTGSMVPL